MLQAKGEFLCWAPRYTRRPIIGAPDFVLGNLIPDEGIEEYLKMIFQDVTEVAGGADFYVGLCNQTPTRTTVLGDINSEPDSTGGYARQTIERSAVGWPTIATVNGQKTITSATVSFTASGADFSAGFTRLFLTDAASGTTGVLFSITGARASALTILEDQTFQTAYRIYLINGQ